MHSKELNPLIVSGKSQKQKQCAVFFRPAASRRLNAWGCRVARQIPIGDSRRLQKKDRFEKSLEGSSWQRGVICESQGNAKARIRKLRYLRRPRTGGDPVPRDFRGASRA